jgi:phosphatidylglycerol:prolipoprotein diacylglycerol transferase
MQLPENVLISSLFYALGYLTGWMAFLWMAWKRQLATVGILGVAIAALFGGLLGANLAHLLATGSPGKTVLGGIAGGYLAVALFKKYIGLRRPTGDLFAVALCAGEAVGRWGCYFGGCCYGRPTQVAWAIWQHEAHRHPTQIYLALAALVILLVLLWRERRNPPENFLFYLQGVLYCAARFGIEFFRDGHSLWNGLSMAQWACLGGILFFGIRLRGMQRVAAQPA